MGANEVAIDNVPQSQNVQKEARIISGFWRRLLAFILDSIILGIAGLVFGTVFFKFFSGLGAWGRLFGFAVALLYFGISNSAVFNGQTLGKRILKIKVVGKDGKCISLLRSFSRFMILGPPYFLNGAAISPEIMDNSVFATLIALVVFFMGAAIIYLFIFNRATRQSLHDLVVGTYVVKVSPQTELNVPPIWKGHLTTVCAIFIAVIVGTTVVLPRLVNTDFFGDLTAVQKGIQQSGIVHFATVTVGKSQGTHTAEAATENWQTTFISTTAILKEKPINYDDIFNRIAAIVLDNFPDVGSKDLLVINLSYGYDIGISSSWVRQTKRLTPQEWRLRLMMDSGKTEI